MYQPYLNTNSDTIAHFHQSQQFHVAVQCAYGDFCLGNMSLNYKVTSSYIYSFQKKQGWASIRECAFNRVDMVSLITLTVSEISSLGGNEMNQA